MDVSEFDVDKLRDHSNHRVIELSTGNKFHIKRQGQHGWWKIHLDKGILPPYLDSQYTSFEYARQAIENYAKIVDKKISAVTDKH